MKKTLLALLSILGLAFMLFKVGASEVNGQTSVSVNQQGGKFGAVSVDYSTTFDDSTTIKNGDTITFKLPEELKLQAGISFNVFNAEGNVIGHAIADTSTDTVRVTFNNYFEKNANNKSMKLNISTKWNTEIVEGGKKYNLNFNGFIVPVDIAPDKGPDVQEMVFKWGSQVAEEPNKVHWWTRFNYAKKSLNNVVIKDTWDDNQEYVPNSMRIRVVSSIDPWTEIKSIDESQVTFTKDGFELHLDSLDQILSIDYYVKLKDTKKNPTNSVKLTANGSDVKSMTERVLLAEGSGTGEGDIATTTTTTTTTTSTTTTTTEQTTESTTTEAPTTTEVTTQETSEQSKTTESEVVELKKISEELPNTGTKENAALFITAIGVLAVAFIISSKKDEE